MWARRDAAAGSFTTPTPTPSPPYTHQAGMRAARAAWVVLLAATAALPTRAWTCFDGMQNHGESGVDCGGTRCPPAGYPAAARPPSDDRGHALESVLRSGIGRRPTYCKGRHPSNVSGSTLHGVRIHGSTAPRLAPNASDSGTNGFGLGHHRAGLRTLSPWYAPHQPASHQQEIPYDGFVRRRGRVVLRSLLRTRPQLQPSHRHRCVWCLVSCSPGLGPTGLSTPGHHPQGNSSAIFASLNVTCEAFEPDWCCPVHLITLPTPARLQPAPSLPPAAGPLPMPPTGPAGL